jgi:hypothetical protein
MSETPYYARVLVEDRLRHSCRRADLAGAVASESPNFSPPAIAGRYSLEQHPVAYSAEGGRRNVCYRELSVLAMKTLHIAPGDSAAGSLLHAIRDVDLDDEVLRFPEDLSCGPIESDTPSARAVWCAQFYEAEEVEARLRKFWDRVTNADDHLVVWFSRLSASELSFFLALADRLGERAYDIMDVTDRRLPRGLPIGSIQLVSIMQPDNLRSLLGKERPVTAQERDKNSRQWRQLQIENAPFRIVTEIGLVSTSIDHFDPWLLAEATSDWQAVRRVVARAMILNSEPFFQVGDLMLHTRVVALIAQGRLLADGDSWDVSSRIRLPS